jgi:DNA-binding NarL/FixJ family response regulator
MRPANLPLLPPRQKQILHLMMQGRQNKEIANQLDISVVTVKMHVSILLKKLGASNRTEAVVIAMKGENRVAP